MQRPRCDGRRAVSVCTYANDGDHSAVEKHRSRVLQGKSLNTSWSQKEKQNESNTKTTCLRNAVLGYRHLPDHRLRRRRRSQTSRRKHNRFPPGRIQLESCPPAVFARNTAQCWAFKPKPVCGKRTDDYTHNPEPAGRVQCHCAIQRTRCNSAVQPGSLVARSL